MFIYIHILSYYKLLLYFNLCLSVKLDSLSVHLHPCPFFLTMGEISEIIIPNIKG